MSISYICITTIFYIYNPGSVELSNILLNNILNDDNIIRFVSVYDASEDIYINNISISNVIIYFILDIMIIEFI